MSLYGDKKRTLLEQKKLQWAKEREELSQLTIPWGRTYSKFDKNSVRTKLSKHSNSELSLNREDHYSNRNLPPITRNKSYDHYEVEGDTSGYASDAKEGSPEYYASSQRREKNSQWNWNQHRSSESDVSICRDERPKWGDRGLGVGHLWEPRELNEHISKTEEREPPGWLQRGLQSDNKEVLVVNSNSPETGESSSSTERPYTGESTNMHSLRTHLRGQNIPLEPTEIAERERKRQKALELQSAIKQQLEEREMKRKQDRERKLREEAEEESRIRREQEIERLRVEEEQKILNEKKEREKKRNEAMQEALENAERAAKMEKNKHKHSRMKSNVLNLPEEPEKQDLAANMLLMASPRNSHYSESPEMVAPVPVDQNGTTELQTHENENGHPENHLKDNSNNDSLTLVLQNPFDSLQGMQLALLVPTATMNVPNALPVAVPISNEPNLTENRVLTPSVYRNRKCREISTQTDSSYFRERPDSTTKELYRKEDNYGSLDRRRNSTASDRKDRRMRSEERTKEIRTEKPKWGANKPPMRYLKQSEKDPAYQKRKMRQKTREIIYEDKNNNYSQSSDDSVTQTPDHRLYRKQGYNRNLWHKNERMFSQNISVYQTEIVPLELDKQGRLYVKDRTDYREERITKKYRDSTPDSSRRLERLTPRSDMRKERLNERNERKRLERESYDQDSTNEGLLVKLDNLRHGLLLRQQQWDDDTSSARTNKSNLEFPNVFDP